MSSPSAALSSPTAGSPSAADERDTTLLRESLTACVKSLDKDGNGRVLRQDFSRVLADDGLLPSDPRLASMFKALLANESDSIPLDVLLDIALLGGQTVLSALTGKMVVPDFARFRDECKLIFDDLAKMTGGNVASYIPQLAKMPPGKFAVAVTTVTSFLTLVCSPLITESSALASVGSALASSALTSVSCVFPVLRVFFCPFSPLPLRFFCPSSLASPAVGFFRTGATYP